MDKSLARRRTKRFVPPDLVAKIETGRIYNRRPLSIRSVDGFLLYAENDLRE